MNTSKKTLNLRLISFCFMLLISNACTSEGNNHKEHNHKHGNEQTGHQHKKQATQHKEEEKVAEISKKQMETVGITLAPLEYKALNESIRANGSLRLPNSHKAIISSMYAGKISQVLIHSGDKIQKNQVIAYIKSPEMIQLQEEYWQNKALHLLAEANYQRQEKLKKEGGVSEKKHQEAKAEHIKTKARHQALYSKLLQIGLNPNNLPEGQIQSKLAIRSDISGIVSQVYSPLGTYLEASVPIAEVIDNSGLHLELNVYEQDLAKIRLGQTIHFTLTNDPKQEYDATVYSIGSSFEKDSHTIVVHCKLERYEKHFIDGMNITGLVSAGSSKKQAVIPEEAIVHNNGKDFIYMLVEEKDEAHQGKEEHEDEGEHFDFKAVEVIRGQTELGYTALTFLEEMDKSAQFIQKGAFFVAAELSEPAGHHH